MRSSTLLGPAVIFSVFVAARPNVNRIRDGNADVTGSQTASKSSTAASSTATSGSAASQVLIGMKGDSSCSSILCVGGLVNGSSVEYTLQSATSLSVGWVAMGFGRSMSNSPMVIMWPNADGSITLSQRTASGNDMPTVDSSPSRNATLQSSLSSSSGSNPKFVYTIPSDGSTGSQTIIWAFGRKNPGSPSADVDFVQHVDAGRMSLNLSNALSSSSKDPTNPVFTIDQASSGGSNSNGGSSPVGSPGTALLPYEKMIIAHAILCMVGFLLLLPAGAIFARWLRTSTTKWFKGHWIIQFALAGPVILSGFALACGAVGASGIPNGFSDSHMKWGLFIFLAYLVQLLLGGVIHYVKPKSWTVGKRRPIQNYGHAVLGLGIIAVSFYQVRTGYETEWVVSTGRSNVGNGVNVIWIIWTVLVPLVYFAGLYLLPRQLQQERGVVSVPMTSSAASFESEAIDMVQRGEHCDSNSQEHRDS